MDGSAVLLTIRARVADVSDSAVGIVVRSFLRQRDVVLLLAALVGLGLLVAGPLARRLRADPLLTLLLLWSLAGILALTLVPPDGLLALRHAPYSLARSRHDLRHGWRHAATAWAHGVYGPLNVLLFVPAGLFGSLALRRRLPVFLCLALLSLLIELAQAATGLRDGTPRDVCANAVGAALGVIVASVAQPGLFSRRAKRGALQRRAR